MSTVLFHITVCIGLVMLWEGVLPLFFTERWQQAFNQWANASPRAVQQFALKLVIIGMILVLVPILVRYL